MRSTQKLPFLRAIQSVWRGKSPSMCASNKFQIIQLTSVYQSLMCCSHACVHDNIDTRIFGGHDYLVDNMEFALSIEPGNADVKARLDLYHSDPSAAIFATLAEEKKTNPFLRIDSVDEFAALRRAKDNF